jgi:phosphatidylglycerol:prolipoprotein diacylglycerol transferase
MAPILTRYGPFFLYSFTVVVGLGILAGIGLSAWQARARPLPDWIDALLICLVAAVVGGRLLFVVLNGDYYRQQPAEIWLVWRGLNEQGALIAAILALAGWCTYRGRPFFAYAGFFAPAGVLFAAFLWLACWLEGCAYGRETVIGPWSADLPDAFGVFAVRYQTQVAGIIVSLAAFFLVWWLRRRVSPRWLFWLALLLVAITRLLIVPFRGDSLLLVGPWRSDLVIDGIVLILAVAGIIWGMVTTETPGRKRAK